MHSPVLAKRVHELKDTQKGATLMCHEMEKIYSEGMESGELKKAKETALSMAEEGMDIQKIYRQLDVVESTDLEYNKYIAEE